MGSLRALYASFPGHLAAAQDALSPHPAWALIPSPSAPPSRREPPWPVEGGSAPSEGSLMSPRGLWPLAPLSPIPGEFCCGL